MEINKADEIRTTVKTAGLPTVPEYLDSFINAHTEP